MKRLFILFLCMCLVAIAGCARVNTDTENNTNEVEEVAEGQDFLDALPDVETIIPDKTIQVFDKLDGDKYGFFILKTNRNDYDTYLDGLHSIGFTDENYNIDSGKSGCVFQAYNEDKSYVVTVNYVTSGKYVMVTIKRK